MGGRVRLAARVVPHFAASAAAGVLVAVAACSQSLSPPSGDKGGLDASSVGSALATNAATWKVLWQASPAPRKFDAMAYDLDRKVIVTFGGNLSGTLYRDTWEWDSSRATWMGRTSSGTSPPERFGHSMVYDPIRKRTFLFSGGYVPNPELPGFTSTRADQWEWDSATGTWTESVVSGAAPLPRQRATMVWDNDRGRVVLFGGYTSDSRGARVWLNDLWEWDGATSTWTDRTPAGPKPHGRAFHTMAYDSIRKRVIVYGGYYQTDATATPPSAVVKLDETWEWDGATGTWTQGPAVGARQNPFSGSPRYELMDWARIVFDSSRGKVVMYAADSIEHPAEVFEYSPLAPASWVGVAATNTDPPLGPGTGVAIYDMQRKRLVSFNAFDEFWEYDGAAATWTRRMPLGPVTSGHLALADDAKAGSLLAFGGESSFRDVRQEFWEWTVANGTWINRSDTCTRPPGRDDAAMVYDSKREQFLLFGGHNMGELVDLWVWRPSAHDWMEATASPSLRLVAPAMFYDVARDKAVMTTRNSAVKNNSIWELDPATSTWTWSMRANDVKTGLPNSLKERYGYGLTYDTNRSKLLFLLGGYNEGADAGSAGDVFDATVWEWDAKENSYTERRAPAGAPAPSGRILPTVSYDSARHVVVVIGGFARPRGSSVPLNDSWEWATISGTWTQTTGPSRPSGFAATAQFFDPERARTLVVGTIWGVRWSDQIWEYRMSAAPPPSDASVPDPTPMSCLRDAAADGALVDTSTEGGVADASTDGDVIDASAESGAEAPTDGVGALDAGVDVIKHDGASDHAPDAPGGPPGGGGCGCLVADRSPATSFVGLLVSLAALVVRWRKVRAAS